MKNSGEDRSEQLSRIAALTRFVTVRCSVEEYCAAALRERE